MHRKVLALFILSILFGSCISKKHAKSKKMPGRWQSTPITIDGSNKDWPSPYPEYDDKAMLGYVVSNDKENLYITVETGDPATQLKILREGLTVWIDKTGEKEEVTAINFPLPTHAGGNRQKDMSPPTHARWNPEEGNNPDKKRLQLEERVKAALGNARDYSLQGFKGCNLQFPIMEKDTCGIVTRIALDEFNELVWEAVIPFKTFYYKAEISKADQGKVISICFETNGAKRPSGQGGGNAGGGGVRPSVGMGRHTGGGINHTGGGAGNQGNLMEPLYKSTKTYKKFGLAWHD